MKANQDSAEWISQTFEQGGAESDWKEYQTELQTALIPESSYSILSNTKIASMHSDLPELHIKDSANTFLAVTPIDQEHYDAVSLDGASYTQISLGQDTVYGKFNDTGVKLWSCNWYGLIREHAFSVPWDITTISLTDSIELDDVFNIYRSAYITPDNTKIFFAGGSTEIIYMHNISTPWDLSSVSISANQVSAALNDADCTNIQALTFNSAGTILYVTSDFDKIVVYSLSIAWDLSTLNKEHVYDYSAFTTSSVTGGAYLNHAENTLIIGFQNAIRTFHMNGPNDYTSLAHYSAFDPSFGGSQQFGYLWYLPYRNETYHVSPRASSIAKIQGSLAAMYRDLPSEASIPSSTKFSFSYSWSPAVSPDGTNFYFGSGSNTITQYVASTPWDTTTFSLVGTYTSPNTSYDYRYMTISPDGVNLMVNDGIYLRHLALSTPWDITTASEVASIYLSPYIYSKVDWNGRIILATDVANSRIYAAWLNTAWDLSAKGGWSYISVAAQTTSPSGANYTNDGKYLWVRSNSSTRGIYIYKLSTPWNITTATYLRFGYISDESYSKDGNISYYGDYAWSSGSSSTTFAPAPILSYNGYYKYDISQADLEDEAYMLYRQNSAKLWALLTKSEAALNIVDGTINNLNPAGAGSALLNFDNNVDPVFEINDYVSATVGITPNLSTFSYVQSFSVSAQEGTPLGIAFSFDGTRMYVLGTTGDAVDEYSLSTAWNVSTASYVQTFSTATQDTMPRALAFSLDGTHMYVLGDTGNSVYEYSLSTAWNVSTASYVQSFSVTAEDGAPYALTFSPDGTRMYFIGGSGLDVNEYSLSTAWNISTATFVQRFVVSAQDTAPRGIAFSLDGTRMYIAGATGDAVYEYSLSTAWNISTASYIRSFSVSSQDSAPWGITFSFDGTRMYVLGSTGKDVNEYLSSETSSVQTFQIQNISVSGGQTTLEFTQDMSVLDVSVQGRSAAQPAALYEYDSANEYITAKSDRVTLPNGKRFAKMKIVGDTDDEVINAKINLWKL